MKNFLFSALFVSSILTSSVAASAQQLALAHAGGAKKAAKASTTYKVVPAASTIDWLAKKVTGQHNGKVQLKSGTVEVKGDKLTGGTFVADMTTITAEDLTDAGYNAKLVGHLKSDDFFSVEKNPTATLTITNVSPLKSVDAQGNNVTVTGNLIIKGLTNPITFPAKVAVNKGTLTATGTAVVDRTKYDIRYGSKSFFESIGDKAIDNEFTLTFNVTAKQ